MWHYVAIVLGVCVCAGQTISLFVLARNPKGLSSRSPAIPEVDEERKVREKTEGQLTKEDGERQLTTEGRGERSALSWLSREWHSQQKSALLLAFVEVSRKIHVCDCLQMLGECKVSHKLPFLCLELTQVHVVRLFFLPPPRLYFVWPLLNVKYSWLEMKKKNH